MSAFVTFLDELFADGDVRLRARPDPRPDDRAAVERLAKAYVDHALDVPGDPPPFDAPSAVAAAGCVWFACWFLVRREEPPAVVERLLTLPDPRGAGQHLSADLTLRFLPALHRRSRGAASDVLTARLEHLLRQSPLSGVLSDVADSPLASVELDGHRGLLTLYCERLAEHPRPGWLPGEAGKEILEWIFAERGLKVPESPPLSGE